MLRLVVIVVAFALVTLPLMPVQWVAIALKRPLRRRIPVVYHRFVCRLLGVRVHLSGAPVRDRPLLIVANHSSWLDISVITSLAPVVFVAKSEIARWPFFGWLAKLQRSVFVERDRRHKTGAVNAEIAQRLAEGDPVLLFGEGTAGDGNRVLPFRTALIGAAGGVLAERHERVWIQPLSIAYVSQQGIALGRHLRPRAAWYGKMKLVPHIGGIARTGAIDVSVTWGEPVAYDGAADRKELARTLEAAVRGATVAALRRRPLPSCGPRQRSNQTAF
jgi:1-acyl-sn-glycerol-3-phosphate acyltransferase